MKKRNGLLISNRWSSFGVIPHNGKEHQPVARLLHQQENIGCPTSIYFREPLCHTCSVHLLLYGDLNHIHVLKNVDLSWQINILFKSLL